MPLLISAKSYQILYLAAERDVNQAVVKQSLPIWMPPLPITWSINQGRTSDHTSHIYLVFVLPIPPSVLCLVQRESFMRSFQPIKTPLFVLPISVMCLCLSLLRHDINAFYFLFYFLFFNLWRAVLVLLQHFCAVLGSDLYVFYRITCGELESPCSDYHNCVWSPLEACHLCIDLFLLVQIGNWGWRYWIIGHRS